ncbi:MAG: hypothetical protein BWY28_01952 [bacterium ADurb.Bin236]|nr:MAG: hypothetical protein BWY28_01952 [bacterium ADurb.Bin236]HOY62942.1 hypothetical protein [bacterium]HPN95535.1 hypothetical protein [bacterium]
MARRFITKETRVEQIARNSGRSETEAAVQTALAGLRAQIQAVYQMISELRLADNEPRDERGEIAPAAPDAAATAAMTNRSGAGMNHGDVVTLHGAAGGAFDAASGAGDLSALGVLCSDSPDGISDAAPNGEKGEVCLCGRMNVTADADAAPIAPGDYLVASAAAGRAERASEATEAGAFAVALEGRASGVGPVAAFVTGPVPWAAREASALKSHSRARFERDGFLVPRYDDDGSITGFSGYVAGATLWADEGMECLAARWTLGYDAAGLLSGYTHSVYDASGAPVASIVRTIATQQQRVAAVISEIS